MRIINGDEWDFFREEMTSEFSGLYDRAWNEAIESVDRWMDTQTNFLPYCRECQYYYSSPGKTRGVCGIWFATVHPDEFCSRGKKI